MAYDEAAFLSVMKYAWKRRKRIQESAADSDILVCDEAVIRSASHRLFLLRFFDFLFFLFVFFVGDRGCITGIGLINFFYVEGILGTGIEVRLLIIVLVMLQPGAI